MKKLVLGALLAVVSSAGCGSSGGTTTTGVTVDVNWKFTQLSDNSVLGCPSGFDTATIISQATDDSTHLGSGRMFTDLFNCSAGHGTIVLPDDTYLIWVQIENSSGSSLYAQSQETFYDTLVDTKPVDAEIIDDGGFFFLTWDLVRAGTQAPLSCASAAVPASGGVRTVATLSSNMSTHTDDLFTCEDHYGTSAPLIAGNYVIAVNAEAANDSGALGDSTSVNATIKAPSRLTDLGHILIPID
jgi:hypothetical protein